MQPSANNSYNSGPLVISVPPFGALLASGSVYWPDGARSNGWCSPGTLIYVSLLSASDGETVVPGTFQRFDNASSCGINQVMWNNPDNATAAVLLGISCVSTACTGRIGFMAGPTPIVDVPPGNSSSSASCPTWMTWQSSAFDTNDCRLAPGYYVTANGTGALCPAGAYCPGAMTLGEAMAITTGGLIPCPPGSLNASTLSGATSLALCGVVPDSSLLNTSTCALAVMTNPSSKVATLSLVGGQSNVNGSTALASLSSGTWLPAQYGSAFLRSPASAVGGVTFMQIGFSLPNTNVSSAATFPLPPASETAWAVNASSAIAYPSLTMNAVPYAPASGVAPPSTITATGAVSAMPALVLPWASPFNDVCVAVGLTLSPSDAAFHVSTFTASQRLGNIVAQHGPALNFCSIVSSNAAAAAPSSGLLFLVCGAAGNQSVVALTLDSNSGTSTPYTSTVLWNTPLNSTQTVVVVVTGIDHSANGQLLTVFALCNLAGRTNASLASAQIASATGAFVAPFAAVASPSGTWLASSSMLNGTNLSSSSLTVPGGAASPNSTLVPSLTRLPSQLPSSDCSSRSDGSLLMLQLGSGTNIPVVCHSGMILLAKLDGGSPVWNYASWLWTTTATLNPSSLAFDTVEAKLAAFNTVPVSRLRLGMLSLPSKNTDTAPTAVSWLNVTLSGTYPSLLSAILANTTLAANATPSQWINLLGSAGSNSFGNTSACVAQGFNVGAPTATATNVRIGLTAASVAAPTCSGWYTVGFGLSSGGGNVTSTIGGALSSSFFRRIGYILGS